MTKTERSAVKECKAQIAIDLLFIEKARTAAQDAIDEINDKTQAITTRLLNLEKYLS